MYRTVPYIVLFLILALLQIFLFDNLSISIYLCPLVYIGFIVLLPIDAPPVAVLFLALSMSVAMDWAMGAFLLRSGWGGADFCATWQRWS